MKFHSTPRGVLVKLPLSPEERLFGLGLQLKSVDQTGKKKHLRVNSDPVADTGDSHAPVPFFLSTAGYGVFVDTARYATFWMGSHQPPPDSVEPGAEKATVGATTEELYAARTQDKREVMIEVPSAEGVDHLFLRRSRHEDCPATLQSFFRRRLPCLLYARSAFGIAYSAHRPRTMLCNLRANFGNAKSPAIFSAWNPVGRLNPIPARMSGAAAFLSPIACWKKPRHWDFGVNLWEHAFIHPSSPLYAGLRDQAGDWAVWGGLVPDFAQAKTRTLFADYHRDHFVAKGIAGFKLDECDNSDFIHSPWSFPECSQFPSGLDGEQMHSLFGVLYQQSITEAFRAHNRRECGEIRSMHALAAPYMAVLYSDLYDHSDFLRGILTAGLSGLLWCPKCVNALRPKTSFGACNRQCFRPRLW